MVPGRAGFAPKAGADRAAARMMLVAIAIHLDCRIIFSSKQLDAQRAMHVIPRAETSFFRAARVPLRHSMKEIPIHPEIRPFDAKSFTNPNAPRYPSPWSADSHRKHPNLAPITTALRPYPLPATH